MGKHKTLQKKKQLELNRQTSLSPTSEQTGIPSASSYVYVLPQTPFHRNEVKPLLEEYAHVTHDLFKTVVLSTSIVAFEAMLYLLLKLHVLSIPFIKY